MKCPDDFCRDAEHCMQGGRCEDTVGDLTMEERVKAHDCLACQPVCQRYWLER
jgi:hypothetical protein